MIKIGKNCNIEEDAFRRNNKRHTIIIGDNFNLDGTLIIKSSKKLEIIIKNNVTMKGTIKFGGNVKIGSNCLISRSSFFGLDNIGNHVTIEDSWIGEGVSIYNYSSVFSGSHGIMGITVIGDHARIYGPILSWPTEIGAYKKTQMKKINGKLINMYYNEYSRELRAYEVDAGDRMRNIDNFDNKEIDKMIREIAEQYKNTEHEAIIKEYLKL